MCTAIVYKQKDCYFGRNLDLEYLYKESIVITPRNYVFNYRKANVGKGKYAIIGTAYIKDDYPLYYDAMNEAGLGMAGLNFPFNAQYSEETPGKINIAPFEIIPYVLSLCKSVAEVKSLFLDVNIVNINFSDKLPLTPLHWIAADKDASITIESRKDGIKAFDNPYGVLTNNPPFEKQLFNLQKYSHLSANEEDNASSGEYFSRGVSAMGLPGDWSSMSRFAKAVFVKKHSRSEDAEEKCVGQFFHMLSSVEMPKGCVRLGDKDEITQYTSCFNLNCGKYYYTTYTNRQICCVDLYKEELDGDRLINYPLIFKENIFQQN